MSAIDKLPDLTRRALRGPVAWVFALTLLRGFGFLAVMSYALRKLPSEDIGLWYVMLQLAGLAEIVEFGFNPTIGRFASYFWAGSRSVPKLGLPEQHPEASGPNYGALEALAKVAGVLYRRFALAVAVVMLVGAAGWLIAGGAPSALAPRHGIAFIVLTAGTAVSMAGLFWTGLLYGVHCVREYNQLLIAGLVLQYAFWAAGLALGWGLPALALGQVAGAFFPRFLARKRVERLIHHEPQEAAGAPVSWSTLWPMTWRSGLAIMGSFMALQGTTLVCSRVTDLKTTAAYGLCMQVGLMLSAVSMCWLAVKYPEISSLRAQHRARESLPMIRHRLALCAGTFLAGSVAIVAVLRPCLDWVGSNTLPLPAPQFALLLMYLGAHLIVGLHAALMQTGNQVPHVYAALLSGSVSLVLSAVLGKLFGVTGLLLGPFAAHCMYYYWWVPRTCWRHMLEEVAETAARGPWAEEAG